MMGAGRLAIEHAFRAADALDLARAEVNVQSARVNLQAAEEARADLDAGPAAVKLAAAQADVAKKRLAVADAEADLAATTLVAPFDGTVLQTNAQAGDRINANSPILTIANMDELQVVASVDETTIRQIQAGQSASISFDAFPGQTFRGQVLSVPLQGALQGGVMVYDVPISLGGADALPLLVGMTANVDITIQEKDNVLVVPNTALLPQGTGHVVEMVNADNTTQKVPVTIGLSDGAQTEIISGIYEGTKIIALPNVKTQQGSGLPGPF